MDEKQEKIIFITEDNEEIEFCVLEQTMLNGFNYLLVTESDDENEDADAYILKDTSLEEEDEAIYEMVEEDQELSLIGKIFEEMLENIDIEL